MNGKTGEKSTEKSTEEMAVCGYRLCNKKLTPKNGRPARFCCTAHRVYEWRVRQRDEVDGRTNDTVVNRK
jgi:hypothetical protein